MLLFNDAKKLEKAVGEEAARVIVETFERYDEKQKLELATKGDLEKAEMRLEAKINSVKSDLESKMGQVKIDLIKWTIGLMAGQLGLIALILRFMLKP